LEYYLVYTFFTELKKHQTVAAMHEHAKEQSSKTAVRSPIKAKPPKEVQDQQAKDQPAKPAKANSDQAAEAPPSPSKGKSGDSPTPAASEDEEDSTRVLDSGPARGVADRSSADNDKTDGREKDQKNQKKKNKKHGKEQDEESDGDGDASPGEQPADDADAVAASKRKKQKSKRTSRRDEETESEDESAEKPVVKRRRPSTGAGSAPRKGRKSGDGDGGQATSGKSPRSNYVANSDSPILRKYDSFASLRAEFQQMMWARDGFVRKDAAMDRKLNLHNLYQVARKQWTSKQVKGLVDDFEASITDASDQ